MKKLLTVCFVLSLIVEFGIAQPSVTSTTGKIGFNLSSYGRLRVGTHPFTTTGREVDRMTPVVAQSKDAVFDYQNDADSTIEVARLVTIAGVDTAVETLLDNEYSMLPPRIKIRTTVMSWQNQSYLIVRYTIIADTINLGSLYHGAVVIPRVKGIYGGEIVKYNSTKKVAYYYREGDSYWGVKALNPQIFGLRTLDWDEYSSNPNGDAATDSLREAMMKYSQFDAEVTAGANGSIFSINTGKNSFTKVGDSVQIYFALAYGATENALYAAIDSATVKYPTIATSVNQYRDAAPSEFSLGQNYPNPFNPSTQITFSVPLTQYVHLAVYDALGREIQTLVSKTLDAGKYAATFTSSKLSSGIYYYTLKAGNYRETKKMIVIK